jgi:hypothetical protein
VLLLLTSKNHVVWAQYGCARYCTRKCALSQAATPAGRSTSNGVGRTRGQRPWDPGTPASAAHTQHSRSAAEAQEADPTKSKNPPKERMRMMRRRRRAFWSKRLMTLRHRLKKRRARGCRGQEVRPRAAASREYRRFTSSRPPTSTRTQSRLSAHQECGIRARFSRRSSPQRTRDAADARRRRVRPIDHKRTRSLGDERLLRAHGSSRNRSTSGTANNCSLCVLLSSTLEGQALLQYYSSTYHGSS